MNKNKTLSGGGKKLTGGWKWGWRGREVGGEKWGKGGEVGERGKEVVNGYSLSSPLYPNIPFGSRVVIGFPH